MNFYVGETRDKLGPNYYKELANKTKNASLSPETKQVCMVLYWVHMPRNVSSPKGHSCIPYFKDDIVFVLNVCLVETKACNAKYPSLTCERKNA